MCSGVQEAVRLSMSMHFTVLLTGPMHLPARVSWESAHPAGAEYEMRCPSAVLAEHYVVVSLVRVRFPPRHRSILIVHPGYLLSSSLSHSCVSLLPVGYPSSSLSYFHAFSLQCLAVSVVLLVRIIAPQCRSNHGCPTSLMSKGLMCRSHTKLCRICLPDTSGV